MLLAASCSNAPLVVSDVDTTGSWNPAPDADGGLAGFARSDGDRLLNTEEQQLGTDPNNPDTDGDQLTDYEEVRTYGTDPLERDLAGPGERAGHFHRTGALCALQRVRGPDGRWQKARFSGMGGWESGCTDPL